MSFAPTVIEALVGSSIENGALRLHDGAAAWSPDAFIEDIGLPTPSTGVWPRWTMVHNHGILKSALMTLGVEHHHEGDDIVMSSHWEGLVEGLGLEVRSGAVRIAVEARPHIDDRVGRIREATAVIAQENARQEDLDGRRAVVRMKSETAARQKGLGIQDTDAVGKAAAEEITDPGPADTTALRAAQVLLDEHEVERSLWLVRRLSTLRWEDSAPCRVGSRMGRPEKAGVREMKPMVHALYPIGENGGPQRLLGLAAGKGVIRGEMGPRLCVK